MQAKLLIQDNLKTKNPYLNLGCCGLTGAEDCFELLAEATHLEVLVLSHHYKDYDLDINEWVYRGDSARHDNYNLIGQVPHHLPKSLKKLVIERQDDAPYLLEGLERLQELKELELLWLDRVPEVQNLDFLQGMPNLKALHLGFMPHLTDLAVLASMGNHLMALDLKHCPQLANFDPIDKLTTLKSLQITNCDLLTDTGFLANQCQLINLGLGNCKQLEKLSPLTGLKQLERMSLGHNIKLHDIEAVGHITWLRRLTLHNLPSLKNLAALQRLDSIQELHLVGNNSIDSFTPLEYLPKLETLRLDQMQFENIGFVQKMPDLKALLLRNNPKLNNIEALAHLQKAELLDIRSNSSLTNIEALGALNNLRTLDLTHNGNIINIDVLSKLKKLHTLKLTTNSTDIKSLDGLTQLTSLELRGDYFEDISPLAHLTSLENVSISGRKFKDIQALRYLIKLKKLAISSGKIADITSISRLPLLEDLGLANNQLKNVGELCNLPHLVVLNLNDNQIEDVNQLKACPKLEHLLLDKNGLKTLYITEGFASLKALELKNNLLESVTLRNLSCLERLDFYQNPLKAVNIENLSNMMVLNLSRLGLQELTLVGLPKLQYLHLNNNMLLTPTIKEVTALRVLNIAENRLQDASFLNDLKKLKTLNLSLNYRLRDFSFLKELVQLETLDLDSARLDSLDFVTHLPKLHSLNISSCWGIDLAPLLRIGKQLSTLRLSKVSTPDLSFLQACTQLSWLELTHNEFTDITPLKHLQNLKSLGLGDNPQIEDYTPLSELKGLKHLGLSNNHLMDISFLKPLNQLVNVGLENNQISDISVFAGFKNLRQLALKQNQVHSINLSLLQSLPSLRYFTLQDNPLSNVPAQFIDTSGDLSDLTNYLQDLEQGKVNIYQTKLILIGNGRVGKTTLIRRWLENTFDPNEPSTHAIQLHSYPLKAFANEQGYDQVQLNIWDFGGQDIYHSTHRMFMQTQALFLLLWDEPTEKSLYGENKVKQPVVEASGYQDTHHTLMDWLSYVETLSKDSSVIILQTKRGKLGQQQDPPSKITIQQKHAQRIKGFLSVESSEESKYQNGLSDLLNCILGIVETEVKETCTNFPKSWWKVQQIIENLSATQRTLDWVRFQEICLQQGLPSASMHTLGRYLHDTGFFFRRGGYFEGDIILDQKWVIDIVYALFDRGNDSLFLELHHNGFFTGKHLARVWTNHTQGEQALFVSFMESCGICVEIGQKRQNKDIDFAQRKYLCPQLLLDEEIPNTDGYFPPTEGLFYKFVHPFLHAAVIQQFIVRMVTHVHNKDLNTNLRKNSVFLEINGQKALVKASPSHNELLIRVSKIEDKDILHRILIELSTIQKGIHGIEQWVSIDGEGYVCLEQLESASQNEYIKASNDVEYLRSSFREYVTLKKRASFEAQVNKQDSPTPSTSINQIIYGDVHNHAEEGGIVISGSVGNINIERGEHHNLNHLPKPNHDPSPALKDAVAQALKHLNNAEIAKYFEVLSVDLIPTHYLTTYNRLMKTFLNEGARVDYEQQLRVLAQSLLSGG
jgi:Leucine-rich repeat (LRR) protein/GTPase SAR1 family protein